MDVSDVLLKLRSFNSVFAKSKQFRFLAVGGVNTIFGTASYPIIYWVLKSLSLHYQVILLIAQAVSVLFSYSTMKLFVFHTKGNYFRELARFTSLYSMVLGANIVALPLLVEIFKIPPIIAQPGYSVVTAIVSYFWHNHVTFPKQADLNHASNAEAKRMLPSRER